MHQYALSQGKCPPTNAKFLYVCNTKQASTVFLQFISNEAKVEFNDSLQCTWDNRKSFNFLLNIFIDAEHAQANNFVSGTIAAISGCSTSKRHKKAKEIPFSFFATDDSFKNRI